MIGGLGNQLFMYSLYYWLQKGGHEVALDPSYFDFYSLHNGFELLEVFSISPRLASETEVNQFIHGFRESGSIYVAIKKKVFSLTDWQILRDSTVKWEYRDKKKNNRLFSLDSAYLIGYWSREDFILKLRSELSDHLEFNCQKKLSIENTESLDLVQKNTTITIHVRGGDYSMKARLGDDYYTNALSMFKDGLDFKDLVVFTNDPEHTKLVLKNYDFKIIDYNQGLDSNLDMFLMSQARNLIIANSTFSWWAAYLGNQNKRVIYPISFGLASFEGWRGID